MKKLGKNLIKSGLKSFGYELRRMRSMPIPQIYRDPLEAVEAISGGKSAGFCCPIEQCVIFNGLSFSSQGWHPFVAAAQEYLSGHHKTYRGSILEKYYSVWQPRNALEAFIGAVNGPREFLDYPPFLLHAPWSHFSDCEMLSLISNIAKQEASDFGVDSLSISDGYGLQGPVSYQKGELEYFRLVSVLESVKIKGYDRYYGDINVEIMKMDKKLSFRVIHGHHRVAALAALGHDSFIAVPKMLISKDDVERWPHVLNKTWSISQALKYFNHLFEFNSIQWAIDKKLYSDTSSFR